MDESEAMRERSCERTSFGENRNRRNKGKDHTLDN